MAWLCAAALTVALLPMNWRISAALANESSSSISNRSDETRSALDVPGPAAQRADFVSALPGLVDPGETIRFASRLAQDQDVRITQMQSESVGTDAKKLGQAKFTLQLVGDYANIKNVVIGLLAKFPGLALRHLTVRHRDASPGTPADKGSEEATLELIQYIRPATMS